MAVLISAVKPVLITAAESLTKVEIVVVSIHVVAGITEVRVLVCKRVPVVEGPPIPAVCNSRANPFVKAVVHGVAKPGADLVVFSLNERRCCRCMHDHLFAEERAGPANRGEGNGKKNCNSPPDIREA